MSQHIGLVAISTGVATLIGLPLGVLVARRPAWCRPVLGLANVFQTIPSLALFGLLIPVFGIGAWTAITALVAYALLPIIRNTYAGITGVDPAVRDKYFEDAHAFRFDHWAQMWELAYEQWREIPSKPPTTRRGVIELIPDPEATHRFWETYDKLWREA